MERKGEPESHLALDAYYNKKFMLPMGRVIEAG